MTHMTQTPRAPRTAGMTAKIKAYGKSKLLKNLSIVFLESILTKGLSFLVILMLSRTLGPEDYGKYSYIFVAVAFCSAFFDFGMENTAVRFSSREKERTPAIFGMYLMAKLAVMALVTGVLLAFGDRILGSMGKEEVTEYLPYLVIGFVGESLYFVNDTYLQAMQRFKLRAQINIARYLLTAALVAMLLLTGHLSLMLAFLLYFSPIAVSLFFIKHYIGFIRGFFAARPETGFLKELLHYEKWMLMISIPNNTLSRIDFFMISLWVSYSQIGIYNAAFQLSSVVAFLPFAFGKVMLPAMSELTPGKVVEYTGKVMKPTGLISLFMLCLVPLVQPLIPLLLGGEYGDSVPVLQLMLVSAVLSFAFTPLEHAVYAIGKPNFITLGKIVQIAFIVILIMVTVPYWGILWAAASVMAARLAYGLILTALFLSYRSQMRLTAAISQS